MDYKRLFLYLALILVGLNLWAAWQGFVAEQAPPTKQIEPNDVSVPRINQDTGMSSSTNLVPTVPSEQILVGAPTTAPSTTVKFTDDLVFVYTDVLALAVDTKGGNIVNAELLAYPEEQNDPENPVILLNDDPMTRYLAQSGLTGEHGPDTPQGQVRYSVAEREYRLRDGQDELSVELVWERGDGFSVSKIFTIERGQYDMSVKYHIDNQSDAIWTGHFYSQLARTSHRPKSKGLFYDVTYLGAAMSSEEKPYEKISFSDMTKSTVSLQTRGGWAAMIQHYFVSAWVPPENQINYFYSQVAGGLYTLGFLGPQLTVNPNEQASTGAVFYTGPSIAANLKTVAPGLERAVDYGILWFISDVLFWLLKIIFDVVGNWGWAIIGVTIIIKLLFYKLSATSYRSMAKMRRLQPQLTRMKERYGSDKQKFSKAIMEMYKKEKVNPLGSCLPILVQIPVFIALYWVLIESVELRQAPFIWWIQDLSVRDPLYVLPVLMGLTMFIQQKLSPAPPDPTQAKIMMFLPFIFTLLFMTFPAGLVLYWFVNSAIGVLQQWYIMRKVEKEFAKEKEKR